MNENITNRNITNDMFLATVSNPQATTYDFLNNNVNPSNTQLLDIEEYKLNDNIKSQFTTADGAFDEDSFNKAYKMAMFNFNQISSEEAIKDLDSVKYNPFDTSRPKEAEVWDLDIKFSSDINPYRQLYSRDGVNSITESNLSLREIAQKGKVFDIDSGEWLESANRRGLFDKLFGDTLVYAQWDEDGFHVDPETGGTANHKKGDWKINEDGQLYLETLGNREVYGKQVVNPTDILTTDGSVFNKFDVFDADGKEKSIGKVAAKTIIEIAPLLIPGLNTAYGGTRAAIGLMSVLPTFYKSIESLLLGDNQGFLTDPVTKAEGWMAKFSQQSNSDKGSEGLWNFEQMSTMVTQIFSQIYEQRAMASLSKFLVRPNKLLDKRTMELQSKAVAAAASASKKHGIDFNTALQKVAKELPEIQEAFQKQSQMSKAFSLGYMALTSTSDVYGTAIESGFDRRTAGFASLLTASGQYGIMMNNRMGDWFLDKTTGYNVNVNKALMRKSIVPYLKEIDDIITDSGLSTEIKRARLAAVTSGFKKGLNNVFKNPAVLGESLFKNALIEGVEEVTEQVVQDVSMGIVDVLSYLGLTKEKGSFKTVEKYTSGEAFQEYLANFVGGVLGGGLFELERTKISPWFRNKGNTVSDDTKQSIYELVAAGHKDKLIDMIKKESQYLTNNYVSYVQEDGEFKPKQSISQSDLVAQKAIEIIEQVDSTLNDVGLNLTDDEIINKAIRNQIMIDRYEKLKPEGKHLGIEALVLNDFKNTATQLTNLKTEIANLETEAKNSNDPDKNKGQIKTKKESLKEHSNKINDILEGNYGMEYFNQLSVALNDTISSKYGSFDRNTYTKAQYGKSYEDLPDKGLVSKESVNKEWLEFIDSVDIPSKLKTATQAFLEHEKLINPIVGQYRDTGYSKEREKVYKNLINLTNTAKLFGKAEDGSQKDTIFRDFISIMNELESLGVTKFGPWDSLFTNVFEEFEQNGLLRQISYATDSEGNYILDEQGRYVKEVKLASPEYLKETIQFTEDSSGTKRDKYKAMIESIIDLYPAEAFNTVSMIGTYNSISDIKNTDILNQIQKIQEKQNKTEEDFKAIADLQEQLITVQIGTIEELDTVKNLRASARDAGIVAFEKYFPGIFSTNETQDEKIRKAQEELLKFELAKQNSKAYEKTFSETVKELTGKENFEDLTRQDLVTVFNHLISFGITLKTSNDLNNVEETSELLDTLINTSSELTQTDLDSLKILYEAAQEDIAHGLYILNNSDYKNAKSTIDSVNSKLNSDLKEATPEILKLRNVAFDALINALDSGILDREVFIQAKESIEGEIHSYKKSVITHHEQLSDEEFLDVIKRKQDLSNKVGQLFIENLFVDEFGDISVSEFESLSRDNLIKLFDALYDNNYSGILDFFEDKKNISVPEEDFKIYSEEFRNIVENDWVTIKKLIWSSSNENDKEEVILSGINGLLSDPNFGNSINDKYDRFNKYLSDNEKFISNPLYDFLRNYFLSLNSGQKALTILDILQRENTSYNASSGASDYISDNVREKDVKQAIEMLELLKVNIMSASQSEFNGETLGFVKMRQNFANKNGLKDDVLNLNTISAEEGYTMMKDLDRIITKLEFLSGLTTFNQRRQDTEQKEIGTKLDKVLLDNWDSIIKNDIGREFIPLSAIHEVMTSQKSDKQKLVEIEDLIYEHNKNNKVNALKGIIRNFENAQIGERSNITKDMTAADVAEIDLINYVATTIAIKSSDYLKYRYNTLAKETKAPFYMQEFVSRMIYASIVNPELFSAIFDVKKDKYKDDVSLITIVLGSAGSGKTTAILGSVIDMLRQSNTKSNIWLSAPSDVQTDNLSNAIQRATGTDGLKYTSFNKQKLFNQFGSYVAELYTQIQDLLENADNLKEFTADEAAKNPEQLDLISIVDGVLQAKLPDDLINNIDFSSLPNLLVIDEVTHFNNAELQLLNAVSAASKTADNTNFMKIVAMGDQNQLGYTIKYKEGYYNFNIEGINATFTPLLLTTLRSANDQKRINNDILLNLSDTAQVVSRGKKTADAMNTAVRHKLNDVNVETGLKYYLDNETFKGDYILDNYKDKHVFDVIAKNYAKDPTIKIGVLAENGIINPELEETLKSVGLSSSNIILFDPKTIQGSEVDYLIFGVSDIFKYNRLKENLKALYTYSSRSISGSIIIDPENQLSQILNVANAKKSEYYRDYDPFTEALINALKEERSEEINSLLNGDLKFNGEIFKWLSNLLSEPTKDLVYGVEAKGDLYVEIPEDGTKVTELQKQAIGKIDAKDFKLMLHSFYNSPSARLESENGVPTKLTVDRSLPNFDLNGLRNVSDSDALKTIISEWINLKYNILHNNKIRTTNYKNYLSHIFNDNFNNPISNYSIKYLVTARRYNDELHTAYAKFEGAELSEKKSLANTDLFLNLTAELTINGKVHYITLATFPKQETLFTKGLSNVGGDVEALRSRLTMFYSKLESDINVLDTGFYSLGEISLENLRHITGTRIVSKEKDADKKTKHTLLDIKNRIPGLEHSIIRLFPGNINDFTNYINKYSFGSPRSQEDINKLFSILKNKPHIVTTFDGNLNGSTTGDAGAKIMPISSDSRKLSVIMSEVLDLKKELKEEASEFYKTNTDAESGDYKPSDLMNAKFETILNATQVLDILVTWGRTNTEADGKTMSMLDLFVKPIKFSDTNSLYQKDKSILDVLNNFKESGRSDETGKKLLRVVEEIQNFIKDNPDADHKTIKSSVISKVGKLTGWNWNFYNLFAYSDIINSSYNKRIIQLIQQGVISDDINLDDSGVTELKNNIKLLFKPIKDYDFYYSIPIQLDKDSKIIVNEFISGSKGFSKEHFSDKFFVRATPEGPRILLDFNKLIQADPIQLEDNKSEPDPEINKEVQPTEDSSKPIPNNSGVIQEDFPDITKLKFTSGRGGDITPFKNFNIIKDGLIELATEEGHDEVVQDMKTAIDRFIEVLKTKQSEMGIPKTPLEAAEDFLNDLGNSAEPNAFDILKNYAGGFQNILKHKGTPKGDKYNQLLKGPLTEMIEAFNRCK